MEDWKDKEISLILPTFNEKNSIRKVIDNFSKLELFKEILVINNNAMEGTSEEINKRFKSFDDDVKHWNDYDYIIINKNLDTCFKQIESIIKINKENFITDFHKIQ